MMMGGLGSFWDKNQTNEKKKLPTDPSIKMLMQKHKYTGFKIFLQNKHPPIQKKQMIRETPKNTNYHPNQISYEAKIDSNWSHEGTDSDDSDNDDDETKRIKSIKNWLRELIREEETNKNNNNVVDNKRKKVKSTKNTVDELAKYMENSLKINEDVINDQSIEGTTISKNKRSENTDQSTKNQTAKPKSNLEIPWDENPGTKDFSLTANEFMESLYSNLKNGLSFSTKTENKNDRIARMLVSWQESHFQSYVCGTIQALIDSKKYSDYDVEWDAEYQLKPNAKNSNVKYADICIFFNAKSRETHDNKDVGSNILWIELKYIPLSYLTFDETAGPFIFKNYDLMNFNKISLALNSLENVGNTIAELNNKPNKNDTNWWRTFANITSNIKPFLDNVSLSQRLQIPTNLDVTYKEKKELTDLLSPEEHRQKKMFLKNYELYKGTSDGMLETCKHSHTKKPIHEVLSSGLNQCVDYAATHATLFKTTNPQKSWYCYSIMGVYREVFVLGGRTPAQ